MGPIPDYVFIYLLTRRLPKNERQLKVMRDNRSMSELGPLFEKKSKPRKIWHLLQKSLMVSRVAKFLISKNELAVIGGNRF